jgi:hypothetical protein
VERFGWTSVPGDKVMQNGHNKKGYNGDIGYIGDVDPEASGVAVTFDVYGVGKIDVVIPAYAATIHKSQGSEYLPVIIRPHAPLLDAALVRGRRGAGGRAHEQADAAGGPNLCRGFGREWNVRSRRICVRLHWRLPTKEAGTNVDSAAAPPSLA